MSSSSSDDIVRFSSSYAREGFDAVSALYDRLELVRVPAGEFVMGTRTEDIAGLLKAYGGEQAWYEWEAPQHRLALPEYTIGKTPVTVSQFELFVKATGYRTAAEGKDGAGFGQAKRCSRRKALRGDSRVEPRVTWRAKAITR